MADRPTTHWTFLRAPFLIPPSHIPGALPCELGTGSGPSLSQFPGLFPFFYKLQLDFFLILALVRCSMISSADSTGIGRGSRHLG